MKTPLSLILVACSVVCTGQDFDLLTYEDTQNIDVTQRVANGTDAKRYQSRGGYVFELGDTIMTGRPSTNSNSYTHLYIGRFTIGKALLSPPIQAPGAMQAKQLLIDRIYVYHTKASRKSIVGVFMYLKDPNAPQMANILTVADFEQALMLGEVFNPNAPLTREEAIAKLKESKDLLDLEVISQSKYDSIKASLMPIITQQ